MKNVILMFVLTLAISPLLFADAGILLPRDKQQPDARVLSLEELEINIHIDNGDARVFIKQIFANHTPHIEEGNDIFALPSHAIPKLTRNLSKKSTKCQIRLTSSVTMNGTQTRLTTSPSLGMCDHEKANGNGFQMSRSSA